MAVFSTPSKPLLTRRRFIAASACAAGGAVLYSTEIERHWVRISRHEVHLPGLAAAFDGFRIAQISDIHLDEFTEPKMVHAAISQINRLQPDAVMMTGDYVTSGTVPKAKAIAACWQFGWLLKEMQCRAIYGILGNHDVSAGTREMTEALTAHGVKVLNNACLPVERGGSRFWVAGLHDPVAGTPNPDVAIPEAIRNVADEPVIVLCHAPEYADKLQLKAAGQAVSLMLSGHTHGGQVRLPFLDLATLPPFGRKYIEGWFQLGKIQLYVNRGLGTVGLPVRFNCPPEITLFTLRAA
jgi:hypothetical protein